MTSALRRWVLAGAVLLAAGCSWEEEPVTNPYGDLDPATLVFPDVEKSNVKPAEDLFSLPFVDQAGKPVELKRFLGDKNVCLIVMRGFPGFVCPGCTAQTSRLIKNEKEFLARECEVLIVYPGPKDHIVDFVQAAQSYADGKKLPFPLLLDENFLAVDRLGIRGELAKPSTYIVDKKGRIRFAYVGASLTDRPSLKAMLRELDDVVKSEKEEAAADAPKPAATGASPDAPQPEGGKKAVRKEPNTESKDEAAKPKENAGAAAGDPPKGDEPDRNGAKADPAPGNDRPADPK